jgi:hypothetical protein
LENPTPPKGNSRDEHRREQSTEDSACPKTRFAEPMTRHGSDCAAGTTERACEKEESNTIH